MMRKEDVVTYLDVLTETSVTTVGETSIRRTDGI